MTSLRMLDNDTCAFILRRSSQALPDRIQTVPQERQIMSMPAPIAHATDDKAAL